MISVIVFWLVISELHLTNEGVFVYKIHGYGLESLDFLSYSQDFYSFSSSEVLICTEQILWLGDDGASYKISNLGEAQYGSLGQGPLEEGIKQNGKGMKKDELAHSLRF